LPPIAEDIPPHQGAIQTHLAGHSRHHGRQTKRGGIGILGLPQPRQNNQNEKNGHFHDMKRNHY
jgi:hypothetical protein